MISLVRCGSVEEGEERERLTLLEPRVKLIQDQNWLPFYELPGVE